MNQVSLDEAIQNLDKIIAYVVVEQDLRLKGIQIGQGWSQLSAIKKIVTQLSFLDRRKYKQKLKEMETRLVFYEDSFISECEMKLALDDVQKVNDLINNYKSQIITDKRKEIEEKLIFLKQELQKSIEKNKDRQEGNWNQILQQARDIIISIDSVLSSKSQIQFTSQREDMYKMLKSMRVSKVMREEEEEELLAIAMEMENLKKVQAEMDKELQKDDENLDAVRDRQSVLKKNQNENQQNYEKAHQFVQQRRRTKIKLFFQGMFTAIGLFGGKIGAAIGLTFGTIAGKKAGDALTKCD